MEKNFHINQADFQVILTALSELPFKASARVIQSLQEQAIKLDAEQKEATPHSAGGKP